MGNKFIDILPENILEKISFKVFSPDQIRSKSVVEVNIPQTYNESGLPIPHGVMDSRMGVIQPYQVCQTCGGDYVSCLGHIGHIELTEPVVHIQYTDIILKILNKICHKCSVVIQDQECPICKDSKKVVKLVKPNLYYMGQNKINTTILRQILEKIPDFELDKLGIKTRPENLVLTVLPVPSVKTRPTIFLESGRKAQDDLTHKLIDIIKTNQKLRKPKK
jgi:DNA-directed RNA polymerase subunit A'